MTLAIIISFSLLIAMVCAGFVWYGWALTENVQTILAARRLRLAEAAGDPDGEDNPDEA